MATAFDDETARVNAQIAELDQQLDELNLLMKANRAVVLARNSSPLEWKDAIEAAHDLLSRYGK